MNRFAKTFAIAGPLLSAALFASNSADACGGCFVPPSSTTVVSGHRMALSISATQTVLWDQIQYQGNPEEFSWVLPIKPGARIEQADNAWFETLEAATTTVIQAPQLNCGNGGQTFGCGSNQGGFASAESAGDGTGGGGVTVVKQETVGPYESVTLSSKDSGALTGWLEDHGYEIPADVLPIISAYVDEGFDFIALKLIPGNGVNLMSPVRIITEGASPVLPLRMVAAGTGPFTAVVLYLIGEGRWQTDNFPSAEVPLGDLSWNGETNESNYAALRQAALAGAGGRTWITTYAMEDALFAYDDVNYTSGIGYSYLQQAVNEDGSNYEEVNNCYNSASEAVNGSGSGVVVDLCDPVSMECETAAAGEVDSRKFSCGELTDLSTALVGMHPNDVWVTRLEANLPRVALADDLQLRAADFAQQKSVDNYHVTPKSENYECPGVASDGSSKTGNSDSSGNGTALVLVGLGAFAALLTARRRRGFVSA